MNVGVDASNLRQGGGVTHLRELLAAADPGAHGFGRVTVWAGRATLGALPARPWLRPVHEPALDGPLPARALWQSATLPRRLREARCDVLFAPGGTAPAAARPRVVMCRNMLPFDDVERARYGLTATRARLEALRVAQARSFASADGVIFLTRHASDAVLASLPRPPRAYVTIPHGVQARFLRAPRAPRELAECSAAAPFRWVYVSTVTRYKHQAEVADAMRELRAEGLPVAVDFVGFPDDPTSVRALEARIRAADPAGAWMRFLGPVPFEALHAVYASADAAVFASSCENMPNILLESMASGLPVASSDRGPMPEILGDAGAWFDPEDPRDIARACRALARSAGLRARLAARSYERALRYSWARCAAETFDFLRRVALGPA